MALMGTVAPRPGAGLLVLCAVVAAAIFLFDLSLPLGVAGGVPYAALVLIGLWAPASRHVVGLALVGTLLTLLGYFLSSQGGIPWVVLTNRGLAFFVIWSTALLVTLRRRDQDALVAANKKLEKRVQERTAELSESNRALLESQRLARVGSWQLDIATNQESWSDETFRMFGLSPGQIEPNLAAFLERVHPDDIGIFDGAAKDLLEGREPPDATFRIVMPDGSIRFIHSQGELWRDEAGKPLRLIGTNQDITERMQAEEELRLHAQIVDQIHDSVVCVDLDGLVTSWNKGAERLYGYTAEEAIGKHITFVYQKEEHEFHAREVVSPVMRKGEHEVEVRMRRKSGEDFYAHLSLSLLKDAKGSVIGRIGYAMDITERKQAEEELARRSEILEAVMAHLDEGISMVDADLVGVATNLRFYELLGFPSERFPPGTSYEDFIRYNAEQGDYGPGDVEDLVRERIELAKRFEPHRFERTRPDGTILEIRGNPIPGGGFVTSYTDITERRQAQRTLHEQEAQLAAIFNHTPIAFSLKDMEGRLLRVNPALCDLMGLHEEEILGKTTYELSPPEVADLVLQSEPQVLQSNAAVESTFSVPVPSADAPRDFLQVRYPVPDDTGNTVGIGMAATDITEVKQAEAALRRSNALLAAVHHAQDHFIGETNPLEIFAELLDEMLSMTGSEYGFVGQVLRTPEGRPYLKTMAITNIAWNDESRKFYQENAPDKLEFHNLETLFGAVLKTGQPVIANDPASDPRSGGLPDGHPPLRAFLGMPFGKGGEIVGMAGIANRPGGYDTKVLDFLQPLTATASNLIEGWRNNERRRQAEEAMMAATEAAEFANRSKSEFLANMSHELRTPLNAIIGFAQMMQQQMFGPVGDPHYEEYSASIHQSGEHLLSLIGDILDLSKIEAGRVTLNERDVDVADTIELCLFLIGERAKEAELEVRADIADALPTLRADERMVRQMLLNLLSNAVKFTEKGGEITVASEMVEDGGLRISVTDTGIGILARDKSKAMSTFGQVDGALNRKYQGVGLGLPLVKSLAELHGGDLEIDSLIGVGTAATIRFPKERVVSGD